jgi:hypothetical protein
MPAPTILRSALPFALAFSCATARPLSAQTREFLDAPVVRSQIRVAWDADTKKVTYAVDDDTVFRELRPDKLFLARTSVFITYPRINPLRIQATASATVVEDPARAVVAQLLETIVRVATVVRAGARAEAAEGIGAEAQPCAALTTAHRRISALAGTLYGADTEAVTIEQQVKDWIEAIDAAYAATADGPSAVRAAVERIDAFVADLRNAIESARTALARIENEASDITGADACSLAASTAYHLALLSHPAARIEQIAALRTAARELRDRLTRDYIEHPSRWIDAVNCKIGPEVAPTAASMQKVVVMVANLALDVSSSSSLAIVEHEADPATLTIRRYSPMTPEIGLGAVFGFLTAPRYGTTKNATGETIVSRAPDARVAVAPGVIVNLVCRCRSGPFVAPMLQIGTATSADAPAILFGAGIRLFGAGKGDVAIGGGLLVGWVKDLRTLGEGHIVGGTADIEADLGYAARRSGYFVIQYKF